MNLKVKLSATVIGLIIVFFAPISNALASKSITKHFSITTKQVTRPDVSVSKDGKWMVYTALGHLFKISTSGGEATQLTFGPYFDTEPVISPDGNFIAFISDRDMQSNGNLYILELSTGKIEKLTDEFWLSRPVWSPDGQKIAFLSYEKRGYWSEYEFVGDNGVYSEVKELHLTSRAISSLTKKPDEIRTVLYLPDGSVSWTVLEKQEASNKYESKFVKFTEGNTKEILTIEGVADRVIATDKGFYVRKYAFPFGGFFAPQPESLVFVTEDGEEKEITKLTNPQPRPSFSVINGRVYLGEKGQLFSIDTDSLSKEKIEFNASIEVEAFEPSEILHTQSAALPKNQSESILDPKISKTNNSLYFTAAGYIWDHSLAEGTTKRIVEGEGFQWGPGSVSANGSWLAFQRSAGNSQQLQVIELSTGIIKDLVSSDRTGRFEPVWVPNSNSLIYVAFKGSNPSLNLYDIDTRTQRKIVDTYPGWMPRPHVTMDSKFVYYNQQNQLYRVNIEGDPVPSKLTNFNSIHMTDGSVSPDGKWFACRVNEEIWVAPFGKSLIDEKSLVKLVDDGGLNFSFSEDSKSIIYAVDGNVWQVDLANNKKVAFDINLKLENNQIPPVYIKNVRLLDYEKKGFTKPTTILLEQGKIKHLNVTSLNSNIRTIDAGGRYAIPGLFDAHTHVATPIHFNPQRDVSRMDANLAYGVTSVRDMGSDLTLLKSWEDKRKNYIKPIPRVFSGGAMIESTGPFFHGGSFFVGTEKQARTLVRKQVSDGVIAIKSYFTLPWSIQRIIADESRKLNVPVAAHGMTVREMIMGPMLGRATIEHQPTPTRVYDDVIQLIAKSGTKWTPTIAPFGGNGILFAQKVLSLTDSKLEHYISRNDIALAEGGAWSILDPKTIAIAYKELLASVGEAHHKGVTILAGTDAINPNVFYGHGLQAELIHLQRAKIPQLDILKIATINAAKTVGAEEKLGSIEAGKLADIILLDKNPLEDISNAQSIWLVIQGGNIFSNETLKLK